MEESIHQQSSSIHHQHTNIGPNTLQSAQMNRPTSIPTILKSRGTGGDGEDEGVLPGSSLFYAPQEESAQAQATGRKKLWQCIYPGCAEPPKTHYNCFSHVWNSHIRRSLSPEHPLSKMTYKNITDRTIVKKLCRQYIIELPDENKRRGKTSYNIDQQQATVPQLLQFEPAEIAEGTSYSLDHDGVTKIAISPEGLARLCVCGEVFAEHGFLQRSDIRFKEDIQPIGGALKKILQITGKTFRYKSEAEGPARMGFIAQELEAVVPDAVHRDEYGLSVDIICLVPLLLEALKEVYVQTQRAQSEKAKRLNEALRDALAKTQFLNEKLDFYRSSSDDDSDFGSISDSSECIKHTRVQLTLNDDLGNPSNTISNNSKVGSKFTEKSKNQKKSTQAKNIHSYGSDELFVGDDVTSPTSMYSQDEATPAKKRHFHYRFSFGPPIIVLVFCAAFFCAGITLLCFLNGFVFAWAYSFFVSAVLALSLLSQGKEIKSEINNYEIEMFWHEENSLNVYFLAVIGTFGLICTLILGTPSIVCIAIFVFAIVSTGILSIAFHRKYRIRMQSILVMSFGVLFFFSMCFIFIYMAQRINIIIII